MQATQEGLAPLKAWVKSALDWVIHDFLGAPDLEFSWVGDDAVDPLQQAQTIAILVGAGVKTRDEARAELGLADAPGGAKFNPYHDWRGRFTTVDNAVETGTGRASARRYSVVLAEEERRGGHTLERHVNISDEQLLRRAATPVYQF
jgi:hypothetical protein